MKQFLKRLTLLGIAVALLGILVALSGIVPIKASSGHWAITDILLHGAMRRSVKTHTLGIRPPPLDDPAMIRRGAGHYAGQCAVCHGSPGDDPGPVARAMTPPPPALTDRVRDWAPKHLFYIVKHGVKFTAMPAWPAKHRDDEVWSVVAFLNRMDDMSPARYRALAGLDRQTSVAEAPSALQDCLRCHGPDGMGDDSGAFPKLPLLGEEYLFTALKAYAEGRRNSGIMQAAAHGLRTEDMRWLAGYFAGQTARETSEPSTMDDEQRKLAEDIIRNGVPSQRVAACRHCHGAESPVENQQFPPLNGQYPEYLGQQLKLFSQGQRGGNAYAPLMDQVSHRLTDKQTDAVSAWYAAQPYGGEKP